MRAFNEPRKVFGKNKHSKKNQVYLCYDIFTILQGVAY